MPNTILHFEIPADDIQRAKAFYEKTFGWTIKAYPMPPGQEYFSVKTKRAGEAGIDGGMLTRKMPGQPFTNYITVKSIDEVLATVQSNGGEIALHRQEIGPGMGWIAAFLDPEKNLIGLHQMPAAPPQAGAARRAPKRAVKAVAKKAKRVVKKAAKKAKRRGR